MGRSWEGWMPSQQAGPDTNTLGGWAITCTPHLPSLPLLNFFLLHPLHHASFVPHLFSHPARPPRPASVPRSITAPEQRMRPRLFERGCSLSWTDRQLISLAAPAVPFARRAWSVGRAPRAAHEPCSTSTRPSPFATAATTRNHAIDQDTTTRLQSRPRRRVRPSAAIAASTRLTTSLAPQFWGGGGKLSTRHQ